MKLIVSRNDEQGYDLHIIYNDLKIKSKEELDALETDSRLQCIQIKQILTKKYIVGRVVFDLSDTDEMLKQWNALPNRVDATDNSSYPTVDLIAIQICNSSICGKLSLSKLLTCYATYFTAKAFNFIIKDSWLKGVLINTLHPLKIINSRVLEADCTFYSYNIQLSESYLEVMTDIILRPCQNEQFRKSTLVVYTPPLNENIEEVVCNKIVAMSNAVGLTQGASFVGVVEALQPTITSYPIGKLKILDDFSRVQIYYSTLDIFIELNKVGSYTTECINSFTLPNMNKCFITVLPTAYMCGEFTAPTKYFKVKDITAKINTKIKLRDMPII